MLTGDQQRTALAIGDALGIASASVHSRVTPEAKLDIVQALQHGGRRTGRRDQGVPFGNLAVPHAGFGDGRHI